MLKSYAVMSREGGQEMFAVGGCWSRLVLSLTDRSFIGRQPPRRHCTGWLNVFGFTSLAGQSELFPQNFELNSDLARF